MRNIALSLAATLILLCSFTANAVLNMGGKTIFTGTLIKVLEPGPATQIQAIINNIDDASVTKPYLIYLGPGVYDLGSTNIIMKEWVSIQGSGQEVTKITGAVSTGSPDSTSAVVVGINNASLADMAIENTGGISYSIVIYNDNASPRIERVNTSSLSSGLYNFGVFNRNASSPIMTNVTASASSGSYANTGVYNHTSSSPTMTNVIATASGGAHTRGVQNYSSSSPIMTNVTASASGGSSTNYGVYNATNSSPTMVYVTTKGLGGTNGSSVLNLSSSSAFIRNSVLEGDTGLWMSGSSGSRTVNSKIIGGVQDDAPATTNCRGNYDENLAPVNCVDP